MDTGPGDEQVKLSIDGPDGPGLVVLRKDTSLEMLKQVLEAKAGELRAMAANPDGNKQAMSAVERGETLKLISWINEQEARRAAMSPERRDKLEELAAKQAAAKAKATEKELEKIRQEELKGKRITIYDNEELVTSVSEASSKEQLDFVQKYLGHKINDEQSKAIDNWATKAGHKEAAKDIDNITLPTAEGFLVLSDKTNPDFLNLALSERKSELTRTQVKQVERWIDSAEKQEPDKIRVFHAGADHPEQSSEISLSLHGKAYVDELYLQLADTAYMLPEHRKKLDRYYKDLSAGKAKEPSLLELPSHLPGKFTYFSKDTEKEVLEVALATRKDILSTESKEKLEQWIAQAHKTKQDKNELRIYDVNDPSTFIVITKAMTAADVDKEIEGIGSSAAYMRKDAAVTLSQWMSKDAALPDDTKSSSFKKVNAKHVSGINLTIDYDLAFRQPEKVKALLSDSSWKLSDEDRTKLQNQMMPKEPDKADEFYFEGQKYSNKTSLKSLKDLAAELAENEHNDLSPQHAKKLLTWITRKEKYGDEAPSKKYEPKQDDALYERIQHVGRLQSLLNDMASNQSQTVDGYYSEQWGADKSALAAGPMGAASGGLRPMGIWQFTEVLQSALRQNLYRKHLSDMHETSKDALLIKKANDKTTTVHEPPRFREIGHGSGAMSNVEKQIHKLAKEKLDIAFTQIYSEIQHQKSKEINRRPNRDNKRIEENLLPGPGAHKGPGGIGGIGI